MVMLKNEKQRRGGIFLGGREIRKRKRRRDNGTGKILCRDQEAYSSIIASLPPREMKKSLPLITFHSSFAFRFCTDFFVLFQRDTIVSVVPIPYLQNYKPHACLTSHFQNPKTTCLCKNPFLRLNREM
uniref:Uncharacterized protein n=1 Tax=Cacopsylla melanoneura TaxID=428564 RepID=A0A8D9B3M0_9HEMI